MKRREFITFLTGAAAAWPIGGRAQQAAMPVIGFLSGRSATEMAATVGAFRRGLGETGYVEGKNVTIDYRWAEGRYDRLPALAAELVGRQVAVIAATGGEASALAAKAVTTTIPIVFTAGGNPVELGLVASLNNPGGNVTGVTFVVVDSVTKRLGLLRHLAPSTVVVAMLINPNFPSTPIEVAAVEVGARSLGLQVKLMYAGTSSEIDAVFATFVHERPDALLVGGDPFLLGQRNQIVLLAERYAVPTIYPQREYVDAGGLMSYGSDIPEAYRQAGVYAGRILSGTKPSELPVLQPTKFEIVINLKTAKALGLIIPPGVLAIADEV